jgi:CRISPR/Cas system-associated endonuclease Cas1
VIQFPVQQTAYLQSGGPHGTSIQYYWPDDPKPTGEYTKWQLKNSIKKMAEATSADALEMLKTAWDTFTDQAGSLNRETRNSLQRLLLQATQAYWKARLEETKAGPIFRARSRNQPKTQMARWGAAFTDYATAQLYSQMVTTKLNGLSR